VDIDLDIIGLGSQFDELDYRHSVQMDKYLDEPSLGGSSLLSKNGGLALPEQCANWST
jgi:hypothetical protein